MLRGVRKSKSGGPIGSPLFLHFDARAALLRLRRRFAEKFIARALHRAKDV
jgi:hypothetical protein